MESYHIAPTIWDTLPSSVKQGITKLSPELQAVFEEEYKRKKKSKALILLLALFFPIQHFLLGKSGLGIIFFLTGGGLCLWWIVEWFLAIPRVNNYNEDLAKTIARDIKIMNS